MPRAQPENTSTARTTELSSGLEAQSAKWPTKRPNTLERFGDGATSLTRCGRTRLRRTAKATQVRQHITSFCESFILKDLYLYDYTIINAKIIFMRFVCPIQILNLY